jgi:hypothetical protein
MHRSHSHAQESEPVVSMSGTHTKPQLDLEHGPALPAPVPARDSTQTAYADAEDVHGHVDEHQHYSQRAPALRAFVLGAVDGLVSVSALMLGVAGGTDDLNAMCVGVAACRHDWRSIDVSACRFARHCRLATELDAHKGNYRPCMWCIAQAPCGLVSMGRRCSVKWVGRMLSQCSFTFAS